MDDKKKATFLVHVTQCENAGWQGQVTWLDENVTRNFRSVLELMKLMDGVLHESDEEISGQSG